MIDLIEYKIITGHPDGCENELNKWKEMYNLHILKMCNYKSAMLSILLLRTIPQPKEIPQ